MKSCMFTGMFRRESFEECVAHAVEIGYEAVEVRYAAPHFTQDTSAWLIARRGDMIRDAGLEVAQLYGFAGRFSTLGEDECAQQLDELRREFQVARLLKTDMVKIECGGPNAFLANERHFDNSARWIRTAAAMAADEGMRLSLEIHNGSLVEDIDSALRLWSMIGCKNVGFIHDAGNMYITGENFGAPSVERLGEKLFHVHVKDVLRVNDSGARDVFTNLTRHGEEMFALVPLGQGGADHGELFSALNERGYSGFVSTEANLSMHAMEMTLHEYAALKKLMAGARLNGNKKA